MRRVVLRIHHSLVLNGNTGINQPFQTTYNEHANNYFTQKVSSSASPKQVAMNKIPAATNISNKVRGEEKANDNSIAHLEDPVFLPLSLPPKIQRNTLSSTYILTRSGQTDLSNLPTFTSKTSPSPSTRETSPVSSRGDMSKQTTPICSNLTSKNLEGSVSSNLIQKKVESSVSSSDSPERPPKQKRYRMVKSISLLRRLASVLHRKDRGNDRALLDDDLDLDEEIHIQDVFTEFNEEKEEKEFNEEKEFLPPPSVPTPISRPSTPAIEVDDSTSDTTPIPSSSADPTPVFLSELEFFSSKLDKIERSSILGSDCSVPSVANSTGSMSSISCEWRQRDRRGCNACNCDGNNNNDDTSECPEDTPRTRYERGKKRSHRYKTDGSASTKSSYFHFSFSCVDSAMETLCEGLSFCFPSRDSKKKSQ
jgi:hypothetical protein